MRRAAELFAASLLIAGTSAFAQDVPIAPATDPLPAAAADAQRQLRQTFTNLSFEDFGPAPVKGPIYQATAGGRIIYFAPESGHLLFAAVYDKNGLNVTAMAQDASARKRLGAIDPDEAPGVGTPVRGGLTYREAQLCMEMIAVASSSSRWASFQPGASHGRAWIRWATGSPLQ